LLVETGVWLPLAAGCRVSTKKAAPPTGRGDKKGSCRASR